MEPKIKLTPGILFEIRNRTLVNQARMNQKKRPLVSRMLTDIILSDSDAESTEGQCPSHISPGYQH